MKTQALNEYLKLSWHVDGFPVVWRDGGANSVFAIVTTSKGERLFLKASKHQKEAANTRLENEARALLHLHENHVTSVPRLLDWQQELGVLVLSYCEGRILNDGEVTRDHLDQCLSFFKSLFTLSKHTKENVFARAAEGFENLAEHKKAISHRLDAVLLALSHRHDDLQEALCCVHDNLISDCDSEQAYLPSKISVLSPSDVGFHNILVDERNQLHFIDFEYFGWDDPAKLICDFLLSPDHHFEKSLQDRFIVEMAQMLSFDDNDHKRLMCLMPWLNFKWCLIMCKSLFVDASNIQAIEQKQRILRKLQETKPLIQQGFKSKAC